MSVFPELQQSIEAFRQFYVRDDISLRTFRHVTRDKLQYNISKAREKKELLRFNFICTHNSRRSQLAQIWTTVAAAHTDHPYVAAYSGGTEATALHPNVITALKGLGFRVSRYRDGDNPRYLLAFSTEHPPLECWSKRYDDPANPAEDFTAIMVCSDASKNCPYIPTATSRISLNYRDPKFADGTRREAQEYRRCARLIGSEIFHLFQA